MRDTLINLGFGNHFISFLDYVLCFFRTTNIIWNGKHTNSFSICLEVFVKGTLFHLIFLFYALSVWVILLIWLFAETSCSQIEIMRQCMDLSCYYNGEKINIDRTHICFSKNVNQLVVASHIIFVYDFKLTGDLAKCLGFPWYHKRVTKSTYYFIVVSPL